MALGGTRINKKNVGCGGEGIDGWMMGCWVSSPVNQAVAKCKCAVRVSVNARRKYTSPPLYHTQF